eukprot:COSAG01_NODE_1230_length_11112_cov_6.312511_1_plen_71_part_00
MSSRSRGAPHNSTFDIPCSRHETSESHAHLRQAQITCQTSAHVTCKALLYRTVPAKKYTFDDDFGGVLHF